MRRSWTDRDGTMWEVAAANISLPGRRIHFLREENDGKVVMLAVRDQGWGRIGRLTNREIQRLLDEAKRGRGGMMIRTWTDPRDGKRWSIRTEPAVTVDTMRPDREIEFIQELRLIFSDGIDTWETTIPVGLGRLLGRLTNTELQRFLDEVKRNTRVS